MNGLYFKTYSRLTLLTNISYSYLHIFSVHVDAVPREDGRKVVGVPHESHVQQHVAAHAGLGHVHVRCRPQALVGDHPVAWIALGV